MSLQVIIVERGEGLSGTSTEVMDGEGYAVLRPRCR